MRAWSILSGVTNSFAQERLEPVEAVGGVLHLRLHALHRRFRRRDREALPVDLPLGDLDLAVERGQLGARALDGELVRDADR